MPAKRRAMRGNVPRYRFCLFDAAGEIFRADVFEASDDAAARKKLLRLIGEDRTISAFELWELNRLVYAGMTGWSRTPDGEIP
jgi:hypothetical protein